MRKISIVMLLAVAAPVRADEPPKPTVIKPQWEAKLPPYADRDPTEAERYAASYEWCRTHIQRARTELGRRRPPIPPSVPVATDKYVIVATPQGPFCFSLISDPNVNPPVKPGQFWWYADLDHSLIRLTESGGPRSLLDKHWVRQWSPGERVEQLFGHSVHGHATAVGDWYYCISDFGLFPFLTREQMTRKKAPSAFEDVLECNHLFVFHGETGKVKLRLGRRVHDRAHDDALANSFFLGPPLALGERFYVLNEKDKELRLLGLDLQRRFDPGTPIEKGILANVALRTAPESVAFEFTRRIQALIPIATDKLIICPTHLGAIIAVNRKDHKVAWTAQYGTPEDMRFVDFSPTWRVTPPLLTKNLLLYAPPDAEALYAFELKDGSLAWKRKRGRGVFLAGMHGDRAIVVETDSVRAINAADGTEKWKVPFDATLTGMGAFLGDRYYLPLGHGTNAGDGSVLVIDLKQGKPSGVLKRADKGSFGNLVIHKGKLISQTFEALSIFDLP